MACAEVVSARPGAWAEKVALRGSISMQLFEAVAVEQLERQHMQGCHEGDMWIARKCVTQGQRPMCRQFRDEAVRERFDAVVFVLLVMRCSGVRINVGVIDIRIGCSRVWLIFRGQGPARLPDAHSRVRRAAAPNCRC